MLSYFFPVLNQEEWGLSLGSRAVNKDEQRLIEKTEQQETAKDWQDKQI